MTTTLTRYNSIQKHLSQLAAMVSSARPVAEDQQDCDEIRLLMSAVVESELAGLTSSDWDFVTEHMQHCQNCTLEYMWLLKLSLLDDQS